MLNNVISLKINENYYTFGRMASIELESAPVLWGDRTFVPLSFFTEVVRANADIDGSQAIITATE